MSPGIARLLVTPRDTASALTRCAMVWLRISDVARTFRVAHIDEATSDACQESFAEMRSLDEAIADGYQAFLTSLHDMSDGGSDDSRQIYYLRQRQERAQWVADWVAEDWSNWYQLSQADQTLWIEHNDGTIGRQIADLRAQQQPRFPGAAEQLAARAHFHELI